MVPSGGFSSGFEAVFSRGLFDKIHGHVFDGGHVARSVAGAQAHEVVVEDNVAHPMEPVFDAPMGAHGAGQQAFVDGQRGQEEAARGAGLGHRG